MEELMNYKKGSRNVVFDFKGQIFGRGEEEERDLKKG